MDLSDVQKVETIVVHDNCSDGLASALLLHDVLPGAKLIFAQYGSLEQQSVAPQPGVLFADFTPAEAQAQAFIDAGALVLDHHKTAKALVARFGERAIFGDEVTDPGVCGATLCYRHVWRPLCQHGSPERQRFAERFSELAGVRDTWQRSSPLWREARMQHEALMFMSRERWLALSLEEIAQTWESRYRWIGEALVEKQDASVRQCVERAHRFITRSGVRVVVFEGVRWSSDAAEMIGDGADLVAGFGYFEETISTGLRALQMIVSTRSHTGFDCASLARFFGGGGHTAAAGFKHLVEQRELNPYDTLRELVGLYEVATKT